MATMQDVARAAGVSIATVSFVVNDSKPVKAATRAKVESAMRELGFHRNAVARALVSRRTHIIALLYPALQHRFSGTSVRFFTSAAATAREHGYHLVLSPISNEASEVTELAATGLVDGVILMEVQLDDPRVAQLRSGSTPFVLIGRTRDPADLAFVDVDFEATVRAALQHLLGLGHRSFLLLDGGDDYETLHDYGPVVRTRESFSSEITRLGLSGAIMACDRTPAGGRRAALELRELHPMVTAVLLKNEHAGAGLLSGMRDLGVRIPTDLSVVSIASSYEMSTMSSPELTFWRSPADELGRMGVEVMIGQVEGSPVGMNQTKVMCDFQEGQSAGPARRRKP